MRVMYDSVAFQNARQRGIQRVFRELWRRLPEDCRPLVALSGPLRADLPPSIETARVGIPFSDFLPRRVRDALQSNGSRLRASRAAGACDVFHSTYYTSPPRPMPSVVTVHDMIVERHVDLFQGKWLDAEISRKRTAIENASGIIAISKATADEVARFFPGVRERMRVVHLAADLCGAEKGTGPAPFNRPYALFVGDRGLYKNFGVLLDAMELSPWPASLGLVVVGSPWKPNEAFRIERLTTSRHIHLAGRVPDAALATLYRNAACVVVPSLVEGFGLPLLEAQQAAAPLVCSDIEVFREVAGDGALYFEPHRPDNLAERIAEAVDPGVRARLVAAGSANAARFSWERCAAETVEVYRAACGS